MPNGNRGRVVWQPTAVQEDSLFWIDVEEAHLSSQYHAPQRNRRQSRSWLSSRDLFVMPSASALLASACSWSQSHQHVSDAYLQDTDDNSTQPVVQSSSGLVNTHLRELESFADPSPPTENKSPSEALQTEHSLLCASVTMSWKPSRLERELLERRARAAGSDEREGTNATLNESFSEARILAQRTLQHLSNSALDRSLERTAIEIFEKETVRFL